MYRLVLLITLLVPVLVTTQESPTKTPWDSLKFFVGDWQGTIQGEPGKGTGQRHYEFVLKSKFLQLTNKSVYPPQEKNPKGEVHEDLGLYSYDGKQKKFTLRQFHVEGFVNEYVQQEISADGKTLIFATDRIENIPDGWRARETYKIVNQDEYTEVFELAPPQKDFAVYAESHWKRVK
jgi:hypothetical protein